MPKGDPRGTRAWKQLRAQYRAARIQPCAICGHDIDYDADTHSPWSFVLDHIVPVKWDRQAALDPGNVRPAHSRCNNRRQDKVSYRPRPVVRRDPSIG
jgi:5-methylcytosine-specific restriction endonuclease McrA